MAVRFLIVMILLSLTVFSSDRAHADTARSCKFFQTLIGLPELLVSVRSGRADATQFKRELSQTLGILKDPSRMAVFSSDEIRAMRIFSGAVRKDWQLNGSSANGRQVPGLTRTSTTIQSQLIGIGTKFGCKPLKFDGVYSKWFTKESPATTMSLMAIGVIGILSLLGAIRLIRGPQEKRRICRVPALLRYEPNCTKTTIVNISQGDALVEIPPCDLPTEEMELHLSGCSIEVQVLWVNSNFARLKFDKRISPKLLDEITGPEYSHELSDNKSDIMPEGYHEGCQETCGSHRPVKRASNA